ncbi:unnamed protein product [Amaranthus hypochondriacus]
MGGATSHVIFKRKSTSTSNKEARQGYLFVTCYKFWKRFKISKNGENSRTIIKNKSNYDSVRSDQYLLKTNANDDTIGTKLQSDEQEKKGIRNKIRFNFESEEEIIYNNNGDDLDQIEEKGEINALLIED